MNATHSLARSVPGRGLTLPDLALGDERDLGPGRTRRIRSSRTVAGVLLVGDVAAMAMAIGSLVALADLSPHPAFILGLLVLTPLVFHRLGLYRRGVTRSRLTQIDLLGRALLVIGAVLVMVRLLPGGGVLPSWETLIQLLAAAGVAALLLRLLVLPPLVRPLEHAARSRLVIIGADREAVRLARVLESGSRPGVEVVGFAAGVGRLEIDPRRYIGELEEVRELCVRGEVDAILLVRPDLPRDELLKVALWAVRGRVDVAIASDLFHVVTDRIGAPVLDGRPLYVIRPTPLRGGWTRVKRVADVAGAGLGIVLLSPVFLTIAVAIKLSSRGPVLYRQTRVGRDGREFTFYKFRSMVTGASSSSHRELIKSWMTGEPAGVDGRGQKVFKLVNDPRVTPVGRFLRRSSLDELPQLFNVLIGDMSLVGPRPCLPYEYACCKSWHRHRVDVTPGCTGVWQVTGRSKVRFEDMVLLDLHYVSTWSLLADLRLMFRTLPVMLLGRGGH